jgi:hypothetical protein
MRDTNTTKAPPKRRKVEMRAKYDFSSGVKGKYADRYRHGTNVVLIDPELAKFFPDSKSVNDALRQLLTFAVLTRQAQRESSLGA